ncbi:MAG: MATE family efflux transporter [Verrucomicrobia bacterium]|nr:MATE family efflux transporter [Verrucomicrobiota bacterium]
MAAALQSHGRDLTFGSVPRHLVVFSMPMMLGNLIQGAYSFVNAVWVGKGLGEAEMGAVTVTGATMFALLALALGITVGAGILAAQFVGARDTDGLRRVVQTSTALQVVASLVVIVIGECLAAPMLRWMDTPADVLPLAVSYTRWPLLATPFLFGTYLIGALLRAVGDSKTPLYFQAGGLLLTVALDPVLMFGWLGCPRLGLNGTAIANIISQSVSMFALYAWLHRRRDATAPDWRRLTMDRPTLWLILKIGLPAAVQQGLAAFSFLFITGIVNAYGVSATAAFGAAMRIDQLALLPALGFSVAVSTMTGQNIGAQRFDRVREVFRWGLLMSGGVTLVGTVAVVALPGLLLRAFLNDPEAIRIGTSYLMIIGACYPCFAIMFVSNGVINGAGRTMVTTLVTLFALWIVRVPLALMLSHHFHRVEAVWVASGTGFTVGMIASLVYYYSGRWKRAVIPLKPAAPIDEIVVG